MENNLFKNNKNIKTIIMKTLRTFLLASIATICMVACDTGDPQAEVKAFASRFAEFVSNNQLDSIRTFYADAAVCDSFALRYVPDSLKIEANEKTDTFTVTIDNGADFVVVKSADGTMKVISSHGMLAFNNDDLAFAKATGQYKDGLTDVELAKRMGVKDFRKDLMANFKKSFSSMVYAQRGFIEIRYPQYLADEGESAVTVVNNTGKPINGSDYNVNIYIEGQRVSGYITERGKDLKPGGEAQVHFTYAGNSAPMSSHLTFKLNDEQLFEKYFEATGKEFDEYIKTKGIDLSPVKNVAPSADDSAIEEFITSFYSQYVFGETDFNTAAAKKYCTPKLQKKLLADYDFEGGGYAIWDFRSGQQDGIGPSKIEKITKVDELAYKVRMTDMGHPYTVTLTIVKSGEGKYMFDEIK